MARSRRYGEDLTYGEWHRKALNGHPLHEVTLFDVLKLGSEAS